MPFEKENITMKITKSRLREIILEELQAETGIQENGGDDIFADNHYCIHHGGVEHNGRIEMAEAIQHVVPDENGYISHYDMRLIKSGIVLEDVAAEDIQVTNASLAYNDVTEVKHNRDGHGDMKKKDDDEDKEAKRTPLSQKAQQDRRKRARRGLEEGEDELEELARATPGPDHRERMEKRKEDARKRKEKEAKKSQQSEGLEDLKALIAQELKNLL